MSTNISKRPIKKRDVELVGKSLAMEAALRASVDSTPHADGNASPSVSDQKRAKCMGAIEHDRKLRNNLARLLKPGEKEPVTKLLLPCGIVRKGNPDDEDLEVASYKALIDTGSEVTAVHARHVTQSEIRPSDIRVVAANDTVISVIGWTIIRLAIGRLLISAKAYVTTDLIEDLLVGMEFLWENDADILCSKAEFQIGPKGCREIFKIISDKGHGKLTNLQEITRKISEVKCRENHHMAPGEAIQVEIACEEVEPNSAFLKKNGLEYTVGRKGQNTVLKITNSTKSAKRIRKRQVLASYTKQSRLGKKLEKEIKSFNELGPDKNIPVLVKMTKVIDPTICDDKGRKIEIYRHNNESPELNEEAIKMIKDRKHAFASVMKPAKTPAGIFEVKDDTPLRRRRYKLGVIEEKIMREMAQNMSEGGIIRRQSLIYESPCFLKKKPNGEFRLLVNYKEMNERVIKTTDRVPRLEQVWAALRNQKYFTTLDLNQGFFQIPLDESVKKYTGINMGGVGYVFNCIPQGLSASPGIFQSTMTNIFHDLLFTKCVVYLDDICIFGKTLKETIENTKIVMDRLIEFELRLKASKCTFFATNIELLGHKISYNKIEPLDKNVKPVREAKPPQTLKQLQSFLGAANYIRNFIKDFSKISAPLTNLLSKEGHSEKGKINWGDEQQKAFEKIKDMLTSAPVLALYDPTAETYLEVDASKIAFGGVLIQIDPETGKKHPIAYYSKKVPKCKQHLCAFDLEMQAITDACEHFREYLLNIEFTIYTDHQPLTYQMNIKKPNARLARLVSKLGEYTFKIKHIKGENNTMADYLSRKDEEYGEFREGTFSLKNSKEIGVTTRQQKNEKEGETKIMIKPEIVGKNMKETPDIKKMQTEDQYWGKMIKFQNGEKIENASKNELQKIKNTAYQFFIDDETGILYKHMPRGEYFNAVPVIPDELIPTILKITHEDRISGGHHGCKKTLQKTKQRYFFPKMAKIINKHVLSCHECQTHKTKTGKYGNLKPMPIQNFKPMEHIQIDFMGKFQNSSEKKYIIVGIDKATKYCFVKPIRNPNGRAVVKFLREIIFHQGKPSKISCDNGTHFLNNEVHEFCDKMGVKIFHSTAYSPQTQGQVERMNGEIKKQLNKYKASDSEEWDELVREAAFSYNTTPIEGLKNRTPFFLMHGYEAQIPISIELPQPKTNENREEQIQKADEARKEIPKLDQKNAEKYSEKYNKGRQEIEFKENDLVLVRNSKKGEPKFLGPFRVVKKLNELNYVIQLILENGETSNDTIHVRRLEKYKERIGTQVPALIKNNPEKSTEIRPEKRKRGRPRKNPIEEIIEQPKKGRGRPKKQPTNE